MRAIPQLSKTLRSTGTALLASVCLVLFAGPIEAQTPEAYKQGRKALDDRDWQAAVRLFSEAIEANGQEKKRIPRNYLPHYFLGLALYESGDCRAALESWEQSASQGVVQQTGQAKRLQNARGKCTEKIEAVEAAGQPVRASIDQTQTGLAALRDAAQGAALVGTLAEGLPQFSDEVSRIEQQLREATANLERGLRDLSSELVQQAETEAARIAGEQGQLASQLTEWSATVEELAIDERSKLAQLLETVSNKRRSSRSHRELWDTYGETDPESLNLVALREKIGEIETALDAQAAKAASESSKIPGDLERAATLFLTQQYEEALNEFDPSTLATAELRAHGYLVQAAAQFAVNRLSPIELPEGVAAATAAVVACYRENPELAPSTDAFSPAFRSFFELQVELERLDSEARSEADTDSPVLDSTP